jgi:hypothetical protein
MHARRKPAAVSAAASIGAAVLAASLAAAPAQAADDPVRDQAFSFAVIGDVPYGAPAVEAFPSYIDSLNADDGLAFVAHVGDIKSGSTECTDEYFHRIKADFDTLEHPLVYTPGDNEWTDCHRPNNGGYNPLERLDKVREVFFAEPGKTLGQTMPVDSQAELGFPENVDFDKQRIAFTAVHVVGSNNSTAPWTGNTAATEAQAAEAEARTDAAVQQLRETFGDARQRNSRAVVVMTQADMFDPTVANPDPANYSAFTPIVETLVEEANRFDGPVYLFDGDSHVYNEDKPLTAGSAWLDFYGLDRSADNLTRVTVDGSANADNWLKVTVSPNGQAGKDSEVLSWTKVPAGQ